MNEQQIAIMKLLTKYLEQSPEDMRFGQALYNLGILEFADKRNPERKGHMLRDIHGDSDDKILTRMKKVLK